MSLNEDLPLVTLETLGHGAAAELFDKELSRVLDNIMDPDTSATAKRSITLKVEITPDDGRAEARISVTASSKIAAPRGAGGTMFIGRYGGKPVATSFNPQQQQMEFDEATKPRSLEDGAGTAHRKAQ